MTSHTDTKGPNWQMLKQKRKRKSELEAQQQARMVAKALLAPKKSRSWGMARWEAKEWRRVNVKSTLSIALPCSILRSVPSERQAFQIVGHIARIASIFRVNEIILFDDGVGLPEDCGRLEEQEINGYDVMERMVKILEYCECPQYLRKRLFGHDPDLQYAGLLYPLTTPHHCRYTDEDWMYREGVTCNQRDAASKCSLVYVGLKKRLLCDKKLKPGVRVTVARTGEARAGTVLKGNIVSPDLPFNEAGLYWGYRVRCAKSIEELMNCSVYNEKYDLTIGTSDKGLDVDRICKFQPYKHALIAFGGMHGLEAWFRPHVEQGAVNSGEYFDFYLNTCPYQGTRTIRTEEAITISLSILRPLLNR